MGPCGLRCPRERGRLRQRDAGTVQTSCPRGELPRALLSVCPAEQGGRGSCLRGWGPAGRAESPARGSVGCPVRSAACHGAGGLHAAAARAGNRQEAAAVALRARRWFAKPGGFAVLVAWGWDGGWVTAAPRAARCKGRAEIAPRLPSSFLYFIFFFFFCFPSFLPSTAPGPCASSPGWPPWGRA